MLGALAQSNTDVTGRVAAAGDATLQNYGTGDELPASRGARDDLVVGGALRYTNGTVYAGNAVYGTSAVLTSVALPNGTLRRGTPIDFAAARAELLAQSDALDSRAPNGTTTFRYGQLTLIGSDVTLNVFQVAASELAQANTLRIQVPAGATVVVNVRGTAVTMRHFGIFLEGASGPRLLFNMARASSLRLEGIGIRGSILAPRAAVTFNNGEQYGTLVGASLTGNGQLHDSRFVGCPVR